MYNHFKMTEEEYKKAVALEKKIKDKNVSRRLKVLIMRYEGFKAKVEQETAILEVFFKEAEAGHELTVKEIKAEFDKACGKDTGNAYIYKLLKRHQWRKVMPRLKHPKSADEEVCNASKKLNKK